jgi:acetolactate synthase I/II/III large subunit
VLVDSLRALGATAVFGLPGVHALPVWEALRESDVRTLGFRTELNAGFAAAGWAHVTGRPAPLVVSTGPGALNTLTALMEAGSSHLPVVAIASQVPADFIGRGRGFLHELPDQPASFAPIVKWTGRAESPEQVPELIAEAWRRALTVPSGPTYLEIPVDVLKATTRATHQGALDGEPRAPLAASAESIAEAAKLLSTLRDPVIWAGGGVLRSGAWHELARLAEKLDAPVATTYMGKGSFPEDHVLAAGSAGDHAQLRLLLESAGVVLCVGTELGSETTAEYSLRFQGKLIQIDADARRIGATYPALGLIGDAAATLRELIKLVEPRPDGRGAARAREARVEETELLRSIRSALPREAITAWDMTILGYVAASRFRAFEPRTFLYPLGSGTLGFAFPAALGAKAAKAGTPVLAVAGDGGFMYGISELASARQHGLATKLLLVDDGGYGILREYQRESFGGFHGVDLTQPDFVALAAAFGVPVRLTSGERLESDLRWAFEVQGPAVLVLRERLVYATSTT